MNSKKDTLPLLGKAALWFFLDEDDYYQAIGDFEEVYREIVKTKGAAIANTWFWFMFFKSLPGFISNSIYWSAVMIRNYLKIVLRNALKQKAYTSITIVGFAIGMACCILIFLYIQFERSYDDFHPDADRIFRVALAWHTSDTVNYWATISTPAAWELKEKYSQVEKVARIRNKGNQPVAYEKKLFYEDGCLYADPEIFEILSIPVVAGNPRVALSSPGSIIITQRMAAKYFGDKNPLGKSIRIGNDTLEIAGIAADPPENTHLKYKFIASLRSADPPPNDSWGNIAYHTYIKLRPGIDWKSFEALIGHMADPYVKDYFKGSNKAHIYYLQPIQEIHLHSNIRREFERPGNPSTLYILAFVATLIFIIACLNFINLTTARSSRRATEVGVRKAIGAQRLQLIFQFIGESIFLLIIAMSAALFLAAAAVPHFNFLAGTAFSSSDLLQPGLLLKLFSLIIFPGILVGFYPAFFLSSFKTISAFKGLRHSGSHRYPLRKILVVGQLFISVGLIISTLVIHKQIRFMKNQHLGFDKEQKLIIPVRGGVSIKDNYLIVKRELTSHANIRGATVSSSVPGLFCRITGILLEGEELKDEHRFYFYSVDYDFISEYGIEIVTGRSFHGEKNAGSSDGYIINETALEELGLSTPEDAIGKRIIWQGDQEIIGVIKDFHFSGLQTKIEPFFLAVRPNYRYISLTVGPENLENTIKFAEAVWKKFFPGNIFEYFFLNEEFDRQYQSEEQMARMFNIFVTLGMFITCLGILGLISYSAEQRTKEIGIRKVLGASGGHILILLQKEYIRCVLMANVIAWPAAYFAIHFWLQNFAYRVNLGMGQFLTAAVLTVLLTLLTISYQSIKAATANPVDSLRYE
ncbi:MAG: FtsX-like permease family protein [Candidatus Aminicenantes bacterium]|nr:FtsX-like permease family protein [Candidatus Aminicenantes bacterium]